MVSKKVIVALVALAVVVTVGVLVVMAGQNGSETARTEPLRVGVIQNVKHLDPIYEGFKAGMTELGYDEGKDIVYIYQSADGDDTKARAFADSFIKDGVDMILPFTTPTIAQAWKATQDAQNPIPIVFSNGVGMVELGVIKSYQSSGNNVTGVVPDDIEVTIKKLEFLKQINPRAKRVGVFTSTAIPQIAAGQTIEAMKKQAPALGLEVVVYDIKTPPAPPSVAAMQALADSIKPGDIDAIVTIPEVVSNFQENPKILINLSKRIKIPILFLTVPRVYEGGLLSYSQDYLTFGKQIASQADKVFKGTAPADIPIEFTHKNRLIINQKVADELGLTIPDSLYSIADEIVK